jgi:cell division control protein 6
MCEREREGGGRGTMANNDIFETEIQRSKSRLFRDRNVLSHHFIPQHLPFREEQIKRIMKLLAPALSGKDPSNLFIYGKTGTGKTASTKHVLDRLENVRKKYDAMVDYLYTNCRIHNTKYQVLIKCCEKAFPDATSFLGLSSTHLYEKFLEHVDQQQGGLQFIIALDEVDKVKDLDELMYALTRSNDELKNGHIAVIGISNSINFKDRIDPRSKSTLCQEEMVFPPYNAEQLEAILSERAEAGFNEDKIDKPAIALAAALAAQESGDARYALRLLTKAGELAEDANARNVREEHVRKAKTMVEEDIVFEVINSLPEHQSIALYAVTLLTQEGGRYTRLVDNSSNSEKVLFSGEVYEKYESLCKQWGKPPKTARWFSEYLSELEMLGLVMTHISGKGIRGNTRLIRLALSPKKVQAAVEKKLL